MNKRCYNNYAWYNNNISNKSKTIYQNMYVNETVKKTKNKKKLKGFSYINPNVV